MSTYIYFLRHGEVHNPKDIFYGRLPRFGISERGKEQIKQTAQFLSDKNIQTIYSSPLLRARQSAEIIRFSLGLKKINLSSKILEVNSSLQGTSFSYIRAHEHNVFSSRNNGIKGETEEDVLHRIEKFVSYILKVHGGKRIVAVSHGDPIMLLKAKVMNFPIANESIHSSEIEYIQHGEVYLLEYKNRDLVDFKSTFRPRI